jgi:hypothetical protein
MGEIEHLSDRAVAIIAAAGIDNNHLFDDVRTGNSRIGQLSKLT